MPPPGSRMTKNEDRNVRYRPGKGVPEEDSDEEWPSDEEVAVPPTVKAPSSATAPPIASTYPVHKKPLPAAVARQPDIDLDGFVTASESSSDDEEEALKAAVVPGLSAATATAAAATVIDSGEEEDEGEDSSEEDEESESEEEAKPRLIAPKFISKAQRAKLQAEQKPKTLEELAAEEEARRKEKATELLQAQIARDQAARAAGKKAWDDEDIELQDDVDDTDDIDPEAEQAAWKLRELKRVKRDRLALIEKEKEREEIDRRRNLTAEEREAEDRELIDQQKAEQEGRGNMAFMQKYYHKGAFFQGDEEQDEEVKAALTRDLAGARFVDESNKELLPEYMRIRDMTQLGRKSRSRYKDLKSEDTGRWGDFDDKRAQYSGLDDRFQPDGGGPSQSGANAAPVGTRRPREDGDARRDDKRPRYN